MGSSLRVPLLSVVKRIGKDQSVTLSTNFPVKCGKPSGGNRKKPLQLKNHNAVSILKKIIII